MKKKHITDCYLYLCTDLVTPKEKFASTIEEVAISTDIVQIRSDKDAKYILDYIKTIKPILEKNDSLLAVNNRADIAKIAQADVFHIGQDDISPEDAREILGKEVVIGLSTHTIDEFVAAQKNESIDYISIGPIYKTTTKPTYIPCGLRALKEVASKSYKPFFAIGGIDIDNLDDVILSGAKRIAVVRAITDSTKPGLSAKRLKERIMRA